MFGSQGQCCGVVCQVVKSWSTKQSAAGLAEQVCSVFQWRKLAQTKVHTRAMPFLMRSSDPGSQHVAFAQLQQHRTIKMFWGQRVRFNQKRFCRSLTHRLSCNSSPMQQGALGAKGGCFAWSTCDFAKKCKTFLCRQQRPSNIIVMNLNRHSGSLVCTSSVGSVAR